MGVVIRHGVSSRRKGKKISTKGNLFKTKSRFAAGATAVFCQAVHQVREAVDRYAQAF
jgi:hypothetical protein